MKEAKTIYEQLGGTYREEIVANELLYSRREPNP